MQETQFRGGNTLAKEETIQINKKELKQKASKFFNNKKIFNQTTLIWSLIILIILVSSWFRLYPTTLPITEDWAKTSVESNIKSQIDLQIRTQRADLPEASITQLVESQYSDYYKKNKQSVDAQIQQISAMYKNEMKNDAGQTYLLAIDPYLWYSYAKWHEKTGFYGNEIVDGKEKFTLRNGRIGQDAGFVWPAFMIVLVQSLMQIIIPGLDILTTSFMMPVLLIGLAIIPVFFLGRKLGGITGGFFAAIIFALSGPILGRTIAGFSDTDAYTFIFPFLILWLFLEAVESKTTKGTIILATLTALATLLFRYFWSGWWFTFDFILGVLGLYIIYKIILHMKKYKKWTSEHLLKGLKPEFYFLGTFIVAIFVLATIFTLILGQNLGSNLYEVASGPLQPINFILGFKGAAEGISVGSGLSYPLWPNVLTTVAELNSGSSTQVISGGGGLYLVLAAILGIVLLMFKKKDGEAYPMYGIILAFWLASTYYAGLVGVRFIALFAPVVAFGIAALVGSLTGARMHTYANKRKFNPKVITAIIIVLGLIFIVAPQISQAHNIAKSEIPSYDDAWNEIMMTVQNDSQQAIITSWWDFGHWFEAMSERSVTFDGGDQGKRIYWIGNTLLTDDEDQALDTLKMLNCGQEESYNTLLEITKDKYKATTLLQEIIRLDVTAAKSKLLETGLTNEQASQVLQHTHCTEFYPMYFITSSDMIGKSGVWGHFGSWNFSKAYNYYKLKDMPANLAIQEAQNVLGYSAEQAKQEYLEMQTITTEDEAATWISPWPQYVTQNAASCTQKTDILDCSYNIRIGTNGNSGIYVSKAIINLTAVNESFLVIKAIDLTTGSLVSQSSAKPTGITIYEGQKMTSTSFDNNQFTQDVLVYKDGTGYSSLVLDPLLTKSMFTKLFFLNGADLDHFKKIKEVTSFRGEKIILWKVEP